MKIYGLTPFLLENGEELCFLQPPNDSGKIRKPYSKYVRAENEIISILVEVCDYLKIYNFRSSYFSVNRNAYSISSNMWSGKTLDIGQIDIFSRMCLRDQLHCRFYHKNNFYINFGHGPYIYIGVKENLDSWIFSTTSSIIVEDVSFFKKDVEYHYFGPRKEGVHII